MSGEVTQLAVVEKMDPNEVGTLMRQATNVAGVCAAIVKQTAKKIGNRNHVQVEGWQAIAVAYGCVAGARDVQRVEGGPDSGVGGFKAIGEVRRMSDGAVLSVAEGFVGDDEPTWSNRAEYARRAMAQTRAISRACRSAFAFVVVMIDASLSTTPAEEMDGVHDSGHATPPPPKGIAAIKAQVIHGVAPSGGPTMSEEEKQSIYAQESREVGEPMSDRATSAAPQRTHEDISFRFGKNKDTPLSKLSVEGVRWYRDAMKRDLADPARNEWRDANTHALACCESELRFRGQS